MILQLLVLLNFALSYQQSAYTIGLRPIFLGMLDQTTSDESGKKDSVGTLYWQPLHFSYTFSLNSQWFISPYLDYSLLGKESSSGSHESRILILGTNLGQNFSSQVWDWNISTGIFRYMVEGESGTFTDGSGTSFHYPGGDSESQKIFIGAGLGYDMENFRIESDLLIFNLLHNDKRSIQLAFTFAYKGIWQ